MDLTVFDALLKDIYLGPIQRQFLIATPLLTLLKKDANNVDAGGRQAVIPVHLRSPQSIGARPDGGALPAAGNGTYLNEKVPLKYNYATLTITGPTIRAALKKEGAFAQAVDTTLGDIYDAFLQDINRQLIANGDGGLAVVVGTAAGQVLTVDNPGTQYIKTGMLLDANVVTTGVEHAADVEVESVDESAGTVTFKAGGDLTSIVDNDVLCRAGTRLLTVGYEMTGLASIVNNDSGTLHNISRTTYPEWKAKVYDNSGTLRDISLTLVQPAFTYVEKQGAQRDTIILFGSYGVRDAYANLLAPDKRYNTMTLDGGWKALEVNGRPFVCDPQAYPNLLYFLNLDKYALYHIGGPSWADEDGHILKFVTGYDKYEAVLYYDSELGCSRPNASCVLKDLNEL
jgi:hypothetical protein